MTDIIIKEQPGPDDTYRKSQFYEQIVEHAFVSEVLQEVWYGFGETIEVLRSEVDSSGYDVVFECGGVLRHVQLKTSKPDAKVASQKINIALAEKPGGCVVWLVRNEDPNTCRLRLSYLYFGGVAGEPLPSLENFKTAKHTKANAAGVKLERPGIVLVPKSRFRKIATTRNLVENLFGLPRPKPGLLNAETNAGNGLERHD
ncbi:hypothetical protein Pan44_18070 [Caulifigura coniformis]|uniref:DUF4365 domain-containing protein n=1 Tax=Caulifigura coniformis TaxID=2527983 RepID=A0A517SCE3_9PLAN|nr:hypothetical protein [Caulifigura coniformis]QDT53783.1 hypothetical protein Pan44_18070 [Caulifigura coniformis]